MISRCLCVAVICLNLVPLGISQTAKTRERLKEFGDSVISVETLIAPAGSSAFSAFVFKPSGFDEEAEGYGEHFGVAITDNITGKFIRNFAMPVLIRQEIRYKPAATNSALMTRICHVLAHSIILDRQGWRNINFSAVPGSFAAAGVSNLYQP